jgi:excisionase family DNA binding protein
MSLVHSIPEACALARAGRTALYQAINSGELVAHKRGKRTLIFASDLQRWLDSLPQIEMKHPKQCEAVSGTTQTTSRAPAERNDIS